MLSLCLALFLADAAFSLADDSLALLLNIHPLAALRGIVCLFAMFTGALVYGVMGLTPMVPKRIFLPITLFNPLALLAVLPLAIYFYGRIQQAAWLISLCQAILALGILWWIQGGFEFRWPLVADEKLGTRRFSWLNLSVFTLLNVFVLLPSVAAYLVLCGGLAVDHFSGGFLALRSRGFIVQGRTYVRNDGKTIRLIPMSHIGDAGFYRKLSKSIPTNSLVLMEGVTDDRNLITNKLTYKRMANSLGVAEQREEFDPTRGELVWADVDVERFAAGTIDFLNLLTLIQVRGMNAETVLKLMQYSPPPHLETQLVDDLLRKRNHRLLEEIQARLPQSDIIIVPWGVAHMPEIAKEIQKSGFRLHETQEYVALRFPSFGHKSARKDGD